MLAKDILRGALYGTATAGQEGSLTDTTLLAVGGNPAALYANRHIYRPAAANAADFVRRVNAAGYTPLTGVLVHQGPDWTVAPLASADSGYYELWPWNPALVLTATNRALTTRCHRLMMDDLDMSAVGTQNEWVIGAAPFDVGIADVWGDLLDILQIHGTPPNATFSPWMSEDPYGEDKRWEPLSDDGVQKVYFNVAPTGQIRLVWRKAYPQLTDGDDDDTTDCDLELITWATFYELFLGVERRAKVAGEPETLWTSLKEDAWGQYWQRRQTLMGRYASDVIHHRITGSMTRTTPPLSRAGARGGLGNVRGW